MNTKSLVAAVAGALLATATVSQQTPEPQAQPTVRGVLGFDPARVLFDQTDADTLWAAAGSYKVRFDAEGVHYVPFLGKSAARNWPVTLRVVRASIGDAELALGRAEPPRRDGAVVDLEHGALIERWHLRGAEVEQTFVVADAAGGGELVLEIAFDTDLRVRGADGALEFFGPDGGVRYGQAVAIDARGRRVTLATEVRGDRIVHRVPAAFVAEAELPLVVDPVLSTFANLSASYDFALPDVAFEAGTARYAVVSERWYSASDGDIWCEYRDERGTLIPGSGAWIDVSSDDWREPKVAANRAASRFLVVAESRTAGTSAWMIRGRVRDAGGAIAMQSVITLSENWLDPSRRPDVGGDGNPNGTTYWAVVWEYELSGTDSDIYYRMVRNDGSIALTSPRQLSISAARDQKPRISKSNGTADPQSQRWMLVFQRETSAANRDVRGATLAPDGSIVHQQFAIETGTSDLFHPTVSSPTEPLGGTRYFLVCAQFDYSPTDQDVWGILVSNGQVRSMHNISVMEGPTDDRIQVSPSVDSDGFRFAVAYSELQPGPSGSYDVLVTTAHVELGTVPLLGLSEPRVPVGASLNWEGDAAVAARHLEGDGEYMIAFEEDNGAQPSIIRGAVYEGAGPGGLFRLPTGCHGLTITATGEPKIGRRVTIQVPGGGPITSSGTLFGLLRSPPLPIPMCAVPCELAVDGPAFVPTIHIDIPLDGALVGAIAAVQGWDLQGGSCVGLGIRVSDTIVIEVR